MSRMSEKDIRKRNAIKDSQARSRLLSNHYHAQYKKDGDPNDLWMALFYMGEVMRAYKRHGLGLIIHGGRS